MAFEDAALEQRGERHHHLHGVRARPQREVGLVAVLARGPHARVGALVQPDRDPFGFAVRPERLELRTREGAALHRVGPQVDRGGAVLLAAAARLADRGVDIHEAQRRYGPQP